MNVFKSVAIRLTTVLIALPVAAIVAWWTWAHFVQSPRFARTYFDGLVQVEDIVESRRWHWRSHPWGGWDFGCTYAIVNISEAAPNVPPARWDAKWRETPVQVPDGNHDILGECRYLWQAELVARLTKAHDEPGSFYAATSETLLLYLHGWLWPRVFASGIKSKQ